MARAVYQDKDLYLIDDIFSAVDSDVAAHIYRKCILGLLKNKTRILCTHHNRYLQAADSILMLKDGKVVDFGPPSQLSSTHFNSNGDSMSKLTDTNYSMLCTPSLTGSVFKLNVSSLVVDGILMISNIQVTKNELPSY